MTQTTSDPSLTNRQSIRLALGIVLIFWTIRIYFNLSSLIPVVEANRLVFFLIEIALTIGMVWCWIRLVDWLLARFMSRFSDPDAGTIRLSVQSIGLGMACLLAILFNGIFWEVYESIVWRWENLFNVQVLWFQDDKDDPDERNGLMLLALLAAYYLTANHRASRQLQYLQIKAEQSQKEAAKAQLAALRNQVNPHFLFNSLSILSSLVEVDTGLSVQFINRLSKAYRYVLEQRDAEQVLLRTELDFIDSYTFLLSIRFDEHLQVRVNVSDSDRDRYQIAPLTLQLLIENAIKHNQLLDDEPFIVRIDCQDEYLIVANPLQPRPQSDESMGVGLSNIISRYRLLSNRPVWVGEVGGDFVVKIPLLP
ncbi:sensor histidine kinase [Emticicia sp. TH156]|uniref:sensor histidine kinase n=1 Tax=Emticicia sp. TH156 TaxID=2067454 RepID=UPI000C7763C6|nr:histidine kinase [Emticicia sp. TH156]PLK42179.1 histidine kinase [Emticicia sp. TH156]